MHGSSGERRALEREALRNVINQWNANRLDLFELSEPNEDLEFHGVMRFYFQDSGQKVATKCIRVASDATVEDVIGTLVEKFRPDMRMLSVPSYALYELHENCPERKMEPHEKPLLVQLNWHVDDREGRFLLKNIDDKTTSYMGLSDPNASFKRKLSKREKKQLKKQEKSMRLKNENGDVNDKDGVAEKLYTELPETIFTRSISNPEAVMRRRRQQKLEKKLQQFRSKDGGPDTGGTLKIYGEALCKDVPYKTLLLSVRDCASSVVREMLDKYGLNRIDPSQWCLVQVTTQPSGPDLEYVLDDDECPLSILMNSPNASSIMFHVRRRPADCAPRKRKKKPGVIGSNQSSTRDPRGETTPLLVELGPDGTAPSPSDTTRTIRLIGDVMEVGSANGIALQLYGPHIQPRHCVITNTDGVVALTPCHADAHCYVNGQRIHQTTILTHGNLVKFGHSNTYRFLDPVQEDRTRHMTQGDNNRGIYERSPRALSPADPGRENFETTFDLEGNVETISTASGAREDSRSLGSTSENRLCGGFDRYPRGQDPILPAVLEFPEEPQDQFLARVITHLDVTTPTFRLAPAYTLYLCARYRASTHYRPELTPTERAHKLTILLQHAAMLIRHTVQERSTESTSQAFWLANASELLHFLKSDRHVSAFSLQAQDTLADSVQLAFRNLVACLTEELNMIIPNLLSEIADDHPRELINTLSNAMNLLRKCRVNAALTIQLFSQLFHWISSRSLSTIINNPNLCCRNFGIKLHNRLRNLQIWAESQGLELAAECHLAKIVQCTHLLQAQKYSAEELANLSAACFKLNSLQLRALLTQYKLEPGEQIAPPALLDQAARAAESVADELARAEGREVRLHDDPAPPLQLLLPDDGFSCDVVQGVPPGLADFLHPLQASGLCRLAAQPTSSGHWTVYMSVPRPPSALSTTQPEVQVIRLHKASGGMGLSIVAAKGAGQERLGIYIKSVVPGGAADRDGRLAAGDQLLSVDGQSLLGITQEKAAEFLVRTGSTVTLEVAKGGAVYHGLATLLQQPSPTPHRGPRRMSERDLPSRVDSEHTIPASKSVPALHHISTGPEQQRSSGHEIYNPGYSRTSSNNSINTNGAIMQNGGQPINLRSRSTHNLHQQDTGFYQNLSVYRNKMPSPQQQQQQQQQQNQQQQQLSDRTSVLRSSQNSLQSSVAVSQRPSSAYYPPSPAPMQNPARSHFHQSIPNLKSAPSSQRLQSEETRSAYSQQYNQNYAQNYGIGYSPNQQATTTFPRSQDYMGHMHSKSRVQDEMRQEEKNNLMREEARNVRSQAKLAEMGEEVRRRQNRMLSPPQQQQPQQPFQQQYYDTHHHPVHTQYYLNQQQHSPYSTHHHAMLHNTMSMQNLTLNQQPPTHHYPQNSYQPPNYIKSPPIAPKPFRKQEEAPEPPPTATHPLYSASAQEPPRMAYYPAGIAAGNNGKTSRDPWVREEQERLAEMRREQARQWQEQQIKELLSLGANRTQQQEEQLRVLQLEREFQRRAMEAAEQDDDDTEKDSVSPVNAEQATQVVSPPMPATQPPIKAPIHQKAGDAPASILKLGLASNNSQQLREQPPPVEPVAPPPPERGSSYTIMSLRNKETPKRVSFNDVSASPNNSSDFEQTVHEDPNSFIRQAESMLASPTTPVDSTPGGISTATPGVIGAQEVYRDPRARRLAEQQAQQKTTQTPVPEKLSFKEKMKMFAMETGESGTPKDKSKISRAQREIDNINSPPNPSLVH